VVIWGCFVAFVQQALLAGLLADSRICECHFCLLWLEYARPERRQCTIQRHQAAAMLHGLCMEQAIERVALRLTQLIGEQNRLQIKHPRAKPVAH